MGGRNRNSRRRPGISILAVAVLLGGCLGVNLPDAGRAGANSAGAPAAGSAPEVILPLDRCVLRGDTMELVAVAGAAALPARVTLDGQPLSVRRFALGWKPATRRIAAARKGSTVLVASAVLAPGAHRIEVGAGRRLQVFVEESGSGASAPGDWPTFAVHPPATTPRRPERCSACHAVSETGVAGGPLLGEPETPGVCFSCHDEVDFELTHAHRVDSLSYCQMCHDPHGGTGAALLRGERDALCARCHE